MREKELDLGILELINREQSPETTDWAGFFFLCRIPSSLQFWTEKPTSWPVYVESFFTSPHHTFPKPLNYLWSFVTSKITVSLFLVGRSSSLVGVYFWFLNYYCLFISFLVKLSNSLLDFILLHMPHVLQYYEFCHASNWYVGVFIVQVWSLNM